ncbi:MAG: NUDIX hydrolase [Alphaproteobacteria bacterium]|nr:NUDIX hydrolase [Alphaproteobacteria bacterium]
MIASSPRRYPARPLVGVGVVVWRAGEVLLVRRAKAPRQGQWGLPGGAQKLGETVFEAARREVLEETGIDADPISIVDVVDSITRDDTGAVEYHYTLVEVAAVWRAGEAVAGGDAAEAAWFGRDAIDALGLWSETVRVIDLARSRIDSTGRRSPG